MSNIAMSLPRGLGPMRLLIIFVVLVSLLLFRSYYLPNPDAQSDYGLTSSTGAWWSSSSSTLLNDEPDVDLGHDYDELDELDGDTAPPAAVDDGADLDREQESEGDIEAGTSSQSGKTSLDSESEPQTGPTLGSGPGLPDTSYSPMHPVEANAVETNVLSCRLLPGADKVVVMVKTGATEAFARVPEQLVTLAACAPNFMVFSDMEQHIGDFQIQDALDEINQEYKDNHPDFEFYNAVHAAHASHGDVSVLGSDRAWALDKWKNIPMLHKAYLKYPDAEWFITIDADTYLSWANLLLLLDRLDPDEPMYAGCVYWHGPTAFAQGGTGYLLSRDAVKKFEAIRTPEKIADWEKETSTICCGDVMLGVAMQQAGVSVSGAWPMFQVDPPSSYVFSDKTWCTPAITWHHIHTYEVEDLWEFEQNWISRTWDDRDPGSVPYLFKDVFEDFVMPYISEKKKDWNNGSGHKTFTKPKEGHVKEDADWDWKNDEEKQKMWDGLSELEKGAIESADKCREVCESDKECVQFSWHPGTCKLDHSIKMGRPVDGKEEYTSGWIVERVEDFKKARAECGEIKWEIG